MSQQPTIKNIQASLKLIIALSRAVQATPQLMPLQLR
jgi:hypothetical protein